MDELEVYQQMMSKDPSSQVFVYLAEALWEREMYEEAIETWLNCMTRRVILSKLSITRSFSRQFILLRQPGWKLKRPKPRLNRWPKSLYRKMLR